MPLVGAGRGEQACTAATNRLFGRCSGPSCGGFAPGRCVVSWSRVGLSDENAVFSTLGEEFLRWFFTVESGMVSLFAASTALLPAIRGRGDCWARPLTFWFGLPLQFLLSDGLVLVVPCFQFPNAGDVGPSNAVFVSRAYVLVQSFELLFRREHSPHTGGEDLSGQFCSVLRRQKLVLEVLSGGPGIPGVAVP